MTRYIFRKELYLNDPIIKSLYDSADVRTWPDKADGREADFKNYSEIGIQEVGLLTTEGGAVFKVYKKWCEELSDHTADAGKKEDDHE